MIPLPVAASISLEIGWLGHQKMYVVISALPKLLPYLVRLVGDHGSGHTYDQQCEATSEMRMVISS